LSRSPDIAASSLITAASQQRPHHAGFIRYKPARSKAARRGPAGEPLEYGTPARQPGACRPRWGWRLRPRADRSGLRPLPAGCRRMTRRHRIGGKSLGLAARCPRHRYRQRAGRVGRTNVQPLGRMDPARDLPGAAHQDSVSFTNTPGRWHIGRGLLWVCRSVPRSNLRGSCLA